MDPNTDKPHDADKDPNLERLVRNDRKSLRDFIVCRNYGLSFEELDEDRQAWWLGRY